MTKYYASPNYHFECSRAIRIELNVDLNTVKQIKYDETIFYDKCLLFFSNECFSQINDILSTKQLLELSSTEAVIMVLHDDKTCDANLVSNNLINFFSKYNIKVFYLVQTAGDLKNLNDKLQHYSFPNLTIKEHNVWMMETYYGKSVQSEKRFSVLTRRYEDARFLFYIDLLVHGILNDSLYTFNNNHPDKEDHADKNRLLNIIPESYKNDLDKHNKILNWINLLPITLAGPIKNPFLNDTYKLIEESSINIVIETHNDFRLPDRQIYITEKTYKPIFCKKPFILFAAPYCLELLKQDGFKTFEPFINEKYDSIVDLELRQKEIVKELVRLNNLSLTDFVNLCRDLDGIVEYNYNHLINKVRNNYSTVFANLKNFTRQ